MRLAALAISLTFAIAGVALTATPAGATSRAFVLRNDTVHNLILESVKPNDGTWYEETHRGTKTKEIGHGYGMDFEGKPAIGSVIPPGRSARLELKWGFTLGAPAYTAEIRYKIGDTGHVLVYKNRDVHHRQRVPMPGLPSRTRGLLGERPRPLLRRW
jgi:hypothetical protein